ncbi:MAG: VTC domain-containing protein, partial [Candidatus Tectomicrobia bacterium]|nr:VTC domain-containing protein [Candidatus Tectomicrobia bacterium]
LTFDRHIRCQIQERHDLHASEWSWRFVDHQAQTLSVEPLCLVECKFGAFFPRWMMNLVQHFDMMRHGFSKYCYSVENQLLLPTMRISN